MEILEKFQEKLKRLQCNYRNTISKNFELFQGKFLKELNFKYFDVNTVKI